MMNRLRERLAELGGLVPIKTAFIPLHEHDLSSIEGRIGARLPDPYREFVQEFGGAGFAEYVQCVSKYPMPGPSQSRCVPFAYFYGGRAGGAEHLSLALAIENYAARMPPTVVPIASDGGGNQICLGVEHDERGRIFYWDHDNEWDEEDYVDEGLVVPDDLAFQNLHVIADSFVDFVEQLQVVE
jgi:hypothetical protein